MDLFGAIKTLNPSGKRYGLVILDDYSKYTQVIFLASKDETHDYFAKFYRKVQNKSYPKL